MPYRSPQRRQVQPGTPSGLPRTPLRLQVHHAGQGVAVTGREAAGAEVRPAQHRRIQHAEHAAVQRLELPGIEEARPVHVDGRLLRVAAPYVQVAPFRGAGHAGHRLERLQHIRRTARHGVDIHLRELRRRVRVGHRVAAHLHHQGLDREQPVLEADRGVRRYGTRNSGLGVDRVLAQLEPLLPGPLRVALPALREQARTAAPHLPGLLRSADPRVQLAQPEVGLVDEGQVSAVAVLRQQPLEFADRIVGAPQEGRRVIVVHRQREPGNRRLRVHLQRLLQQLVRFFQQ